ncbi:hypothetical protein D3C87_608270 [compost metagenome]
MFDQALRLFDDHFSDLHVTDCRLVEGRGNNLALHRTLHVGHFFRTLIDQENDQVAFRMVCRDGMGDVLQQNRLTGARRRHDQSALTLAERRDEIDHTRRQVLRGRNIQFHLEALIRVERRQIVEVNLVADLFRIVEIDRVDLEKCEITLAFLGAADRAFNGITGLQREPADLRGRNIDIVRTGQIVCVCGPQESEPVLQDFNDAFADYFDVLARENLEDCEHKLLLAHGARIFNFQGFSKSQQVGRRFALKFLKLHFSHEGKTV